MIGPRIILVDALVSGTDRENSAPHFSVLLRELSVFLSVVMGTLIRVSQNGGRGWTWTTGLDGHVQSEVRELGYLETNASKDMPSRGDAGAVPLRQVHRPDFSQPGIDGSTNEVHPPADVIDLWQTFVDLPQTLQRQFLQVGSTWQAALTLGHEYETTRFALMVSACESLKPWGDQFRRHNMYHVVEALLGKPRAERLREQWFKAQDTRNVHFHLGEFRGSEFVPPMIMSNFDDPTFRQASDELWLITQACMIAWLRCRGDVPLTAVTRHNNWKRWVRQNALWIMPLGIGIGVILGWILSMFL